MTVIKQEYSIAQREALQWLKVHDKHLWGINASYAAAAKMLGDRCVDAKSMAALVFDTKKFERIDDKGEVHEHTKMEWSGNCKWWKNPEEEYGPRAAIKNKSLSLKKWDQVKEHVLYFRKLFMEPDTTIDFVIRHLRRSRLPANVHIVTEVFNLKKMPLRMLPTDEMLQVQR